MDPAAERAKAVLDIKQASLAASAYDKTIVYPSIPAAIAELYGHPTLEPDAIILGSPAAYRGTTLAGRDAELQIAAGFDDRTALFVEKPVSTGSVEEAQKVAQQLASSGRTISVGYMLRYCKAVQQMKKILADNDLKVMMTSAKYIMGRYRHNGEAAELTDAWSAYESSEKPAWWTKSIDCGPIVEQASGYSGERPNPPSRSHEPHAQPTLPTCHDILAAKLTSRPLPRTLWSGMTPLASCLRSRWTRARSRPRIAYRDSHRRHGNMTMARSGISNMASRCRGSHLRLN